MESIIPELFAATTDDLVHQKKRRKEKVAEIKAGLEALRQRRKKVSRNFVPVQPRYDEEYREGMKWLDSLS